jgi:LPS-assembly protein
VADPGHAWLVGAHVRPARPAHLASRRAERRRSAQRDAQSLVFDDTNLFEWDKFSGYDRQEGGTRANLGFAYQGLLPGGVTVDALVGQSFQLAGLNSFEAQDHALTGVGSGLDDDASDYIGRVSVDSGLGVAVHARGRFDEEDLGSTAAR